MKGIQKSLKVKMLFKQNEKAQKVVQVEQKIFRNKFATEERLLKWVKLWIFLK
jgi:hypothetical protein